MNQLNFTMKSFLVNTILIIWCLHAAAITTSTTDITIDAKITASLSSSPSSSSSYHGIEVNDINNEDNKQNEKEQTITCLLAVRQKWTDDHLTWEKGTYNNLDTIMMPITKIWKPDIVISNFAGDKFNDYIPTNAIISSDGTVLHMYPALVKTSCALDVKFFPFDSQSCKLEFISWTYNGNELEVDYNESYPNFIYYNSENQEWAVEKITQERHTKQYSCCPEPYYDLTFDIHLKRGSLFYVINLITPCFLIFIISFLGFFLPVESGEKVNLEITILLALVVFLLMVGETMPPTQDCFPILGSGHGVQVFFTFLI
ncbi:hypothetical protein HELRODRAFT_181925 [Helobdella robusta]|uniref:Neurotransmitter-gated ion-channel ligand-binding domain-containing protein n=1 Tax=Helobdella robusta TaxID=6412 RepID=T1FHG7_HELRO|nr:hypothetical protein HELRODRAFT_181925 [Helobdella robusta]ESN91997.1 hypothetical protein HELRODRAFT_181925 [Helobdella robusta]